MREVAAVLLEILVAGFQRPPVAGELARCVGILPEQNAIPVPNQELPAAERDAFEFIKYSGNIDLDIEMLVEQLTERGAVVSLPAHVGQDEPDGRMASQRPVLLFDQLLEAGRSGALPARPRL